MTLVDSILFGIVASLVSLKVVLLAGTAMLLLYATTRALRHRTAAAAAARPGPGKPA
ncbi:MAG: hypothetical protein PVH38_10565 [Gammaproteobacteria bacterium]